MNNTAEISKISQNNADPSPREQKPIGNTDTDNISLVEKQKKFARSGTIAPKKKVKMIQQEADTPQKNYQTQKTMSLDGGSLQRSKTTIKK